MWDWPALTAFAHAFAERLAARWRRRALDPHGCAQEALARLWRKGGRERAAAAIKSPMAWLRRVVCDLLIDSLRARDRHRAHRDGLRADQERVARERQSGADPASAPAARRGIPRLSQHEQWLFTLHEASQPPEEIARLTSLSVPEVTATLKCVVLRRHGPQGDGSDLPWPERVALLTRAGLDLAEVAVVLRVKLACLKKRLQRRYGRQDA